jgi:hypothetical protein
MQGSFPLSVDSDLRTPADDPDHDARIEPLRVLDLAEIEIVRANGAA